MGIMTIIIGLSTGGGLQFEIEKKIERFHGSYQIRPYQTTLEGDLYAFSKSQLYIDSNKFFERNRSIESYHFVAWKSGIITFSDQMEGARLFGFEKSLNQYLQFIMKELFRIGPIILILYGYRKKWRGS